MTYDKFIGHVQHRARLASTDEAVRIIRATLETLGERLAGGEAKDLAAQLPREIGIHLQGNGAERFTVNDFIERISQREGVKRADAAYHARVVLEVVKEAVSPGEWNDVLAQLPEDFHPLFEAGSQGQVKP